MEEYKHEDKSLEKRDDHQPHEWPTFDENFCSCCRQRFIHGNTNVVRIQRAPERVLDLNGNQIGVVKGSQYKAVLHARCWKTHFGKRVDCDLCGGFSDNIKLQTGELNTCGCSCHKGSNNCSYILEPNKRVLRETGF